jgi:hypothetical protein
MAALPEEILFVSECAYSPCSRPWWICRCCYRGHKYCSEACSKVARREKKRQYNRDHQQGPGREGHVERQQAYRLQQAKLGADSKKIVTDQSSLEPPFDGKLVSASEHELKLPVESSATTAEANQVDSASCRRCGRQSVLVEPLCERRRIVALLKGRARSQPHSCRPEKSTTTRQALADYMEAIRDTYVGLPITARRLRRNELELARQLYREGVASVHVEAALLVETARRVLRNKPHPIQPIRSLHDIVPIIEQARVCGVNEGYVHYLRHKLRQVLEGKGAASARAQARSRARASPWR